LWTANPPELSFVDDFVTVIGQERYSGLLVLDLTVVGMKLVEMAPKPLFLINVTER
jgi:hypothetical protein